MNRSKFRSSYANNVHYNVRESTLPQRSSIRCKWQINRIDVCPVIFLSFVISTRPRTNETRRLFQSKHSITDRVAKFCINVLWNFPVAVVMKLEKLSKIIHLIIFIEQNILLPHQCNH
ncbi:hypothetical protein T05_6851 [Trichinella murrelli]|uniref:Uncharacterized protein n=1 Tax=Trichinella murrelli TaxID=144512 RepID=A0A0V0U4V1_9BILA|nr:hypothetical protein T05_6851 [Trichinella murrelli]